MFMKQIVLWTVLDAGYKAVGCFSGPAITVNCQYRHI